MQEYIKNILILYTAQCILVVLSLFLIIKKAVSMFEVGKKYLVRTVTMTIVGECNGVGKKELMFKSASWIADTGRFHDCLKTGNFSEVEPFVNDVIVGRGAIVDATEFRHKLPKEQK